MKCDGSVSKAKTVDFVQQRARLKYVSFLWSFSFFFFFSSSQKNIESSNISGEKRIHFFLIFQTTSPFVSLPSSSCEFSIFYQPTFLQLPFDHFPHRVSLHHSNMQLSSVLVAWIAATLIAVTHAQPGPGTFTLIYYAPSWSTVYLHYNANQQGWNSIPGLLMQCPTNQSAYPCAQWKQTTVAGDNVVFVTTDGSGQWDNNGGKNYDAPNAGIYTLQTGVLTLVEPFPDTCPGSPACSGHGTCDNGLCVCEVGYYGVSCNKTCTCGAHQACNPSGDCVCTSGWSTCPGSAVCSVDTSNSTDNCGSCGNTCWTANVATAVCSNGGCVVTCDAGFNVCDGGTCAVECGLPGCNTYDVNECQGDAINTSSAFAANDWQTPVRGSAEYHASYQDYSRLKGHSRVVYANGDHTEADLILVPRAKSSTATISCSFDGGVTFGSACSQRFSASNQTTQVYPQIRATDSSEPTPSLLVLEPVDFIWNHPKISHSAGDYRSGQKGSIVEMFGWRHADIEKECAFVSKAGYLGVKFFPVQEQVMSSQPFNNVMNPWYFMYQPVSYRLEGRMGSREELRAAVNFCRSVNVRAYADAVVNHMVGCGNDAIHHHRNGGAGYCAEWGMKNTSADFPPSFEDRLNGSSPMYTQCFNYIPNANSGLSPMQEFPAVPYGPEDFHCERALNSWDDPLDLNAGWLTGLVDLNTERDHVQQRIADYLTDLLGVGFSGFRIDAAKHIQPPDWGGIFSKLKANLGGTFPDDFIVWMEVLTGGEGDMLLCNPNSGYSYSKGLENILLASGLTMDDVTKIKIWFDAYPKQPDIDCGQLEMNRKAIQNDDADQQNPGSTSRDMGSDGTVLVIAKDIGLHRFFEEKLFTSPNGASDNANDYPIRMVLSSFWLPENANDYGIPDGKSNCDVCTVTCSTCDAAQSLNFTAGYQQGASGYTGNMVGGQYTRVHRDLGVINAMRGWMNLPNMSDDEYAVAMN